MEVLIPMDEEAVKESLAFTTEIKVTKNKAITKITFKKMPLKPQSRKIWSKATKINCGYNYNGR